MTLVDQPKIDAQIRTIRESLDEYADAFFQGPWGVLHMKDAHQDLVESLPLLHTVEIQMSSVKINKHTWYGVASLTIEQQIQKLLLYRAGECTNIEFNHMYRTVITRLSYMLGELDVLRAA